MNEAKFTSEINKLLPKNLVKVWKVKDDFQGGVFDCIYYSEVNETGGVLPPVNVEFKLLKTIPKRENTLIIPDCSELQKQWLRRGLINKHPTLVIVGALDGREYKGVVFYTEKEWLEGITRTEFVKRLQSKQDIADILLKLVIGIAN